MCMEMAPVARPGLSSAENTPGGRVLPVGPAASRSARAIQPPSQKEAHGEIESEHPGYCGAQDTFYVGNLKSVGRVYQQTFIVTYSKVGCAKSYDRKTPITAAEIMVP